MPLLTSPNEQANVTHLIFLFVAAQHMEAHLLMDALSWLDGTVASWNSLLAVLTNKPFLWVRWSFRGTRQDEGILGVKSAAAGGGSAAEPVTEL